VVGGGVLLALVGLWLGHTAEYARVWGARGLSAEFFGSIHAYMLPLAAIIAVLAVAFAARLWQAWARLGRRLDAARAQLGAALRGRRPEHVPTAVPVDSAPSISSGVAIVWPALSLLQIALYLVQENVEAVAAGMPAPGIAPITGIHSLASLVHAGVALVLITTAAIVLRLVRRRARAIDAVEGVTRALLRVLIRPLQIVRPLAVDIRTPLQLIGLHLRRRPPPTLLTA
jgi:hypothetical protein